MTWANCPFQACFFFNKTGIKGAMELHGKGSSSGKAPGDERGAKLDELIDMSP